MNLDQLQTKLLKVARENPPSDHVPYAFETRIMANLARPAADAWTLWGKSLWRAAAVCTLMMALMGSWSFQTAADNSDLSQAFEDTVLASLDESAFVLDEENW